MKISLLQEGDTTGTTPQVRYHEIVEEVALADELGFTAWGTSEQHFYGPNWNVPAPEVLYSAVAMRTERIILRAMSVVLLTWNHPLQVAEKYAALDLVSKGRLEMCFARSNNKATMSIYAIDPADTKEIFNENLKVLQELFEYQELKDGHSGKYWEIPPVAITPGFFDKRFPALSVAATGLPSHVSTGKDGYGVISFDNWYGFDYLDECLEAYATGWSERDQSKPHAHKNFGIYVSTAYCAATLEEASAVADEQAVWYFEEAARIYENLAKNPGYEYMDKIQELLSVENKPEFLRSTTASVMIGTPDDYIARLQSLEERGVDEVVLRIDGFGHDKIMKTIDLIGREVIPALS